MLRVVARCTPCNYLRMVCLVFPAAFCRHVVSQTEKVQRVFSDGDITDYFVVFLRKAEN